MLREDVGPADEVTHPVLLEAVLRAEEAILDAGLEARRALQGAGVVGAVGAQALALGGGFFAHGDGRLMGGVEGPDVCGRRSWR